VAAEVMPGGELRLAGMGIAPTHGLKRGVVVNIDATVQSIQAALKEAEMMAACKIEKVYTGITGSHIRGQNSTGMVIVRDNREVTTVDVNRVVETAKAINIPNDQRLLLVEPQEFIIDGHEVKEPIGMSGSRLEVKVRRSGIDGRREGPWRRGGGHRRRHDRRQHLHRRQRAPHRGDSDCR
jgi:cell division protein FtsA